MTHTSLDVRYKQQLLRTQITVLKDSSISNNMASKDLPISVKFIVWRQFLLYLQHHMHLKSTNSHTSIH